MANELEIRRSDRSYLFQLLIAQHESENPKDFKKVIAWTKAKMEPEDVKAVQKDFDDWKDS